jgi:HlyD family type I secretion membrane fusion protein
MKLDFLHLGGGGAAPHGGTPLPRQSIERAMRQLDIRPLDDAHRTIKVGLIVAAVFVAIFLAFASFAPISAAAIAPAEVSVSGDKVVIQPVTGGIVTQVLVREGQAVRAGQPLVRLNGVRSGAQLTQAQARYDGLRALEARLLAERDGRDVLTFPPELLRRAGEPTVAKAMAIQGQVFARRRAVQGADRGSSDESVTAARAALTATQRQLALITDELADYRSLYRRGFARLTTIRSLERNQAQLTAEVARATAALNQAGIAARRLEDSQSLDFASQLGQVQEQLAQVAPSLDVSRYVADQDVIRAPAAGRVSGIREMGAGMVVGGGSTLMEVVPNGRALIVEARVKPQDIDDVRVGQPAVVRFSTVNPHGRTAFDGRVVTLSPARIDQGGQSFYKAQVAMIEPETLRREGVELRPGIPASVNIMTENRSLFDYLLAPLTDAISRSFREE